MSFVCFCACGCVVVVLRCVVLCCAMCVVLGRFPDSFLVVSGRLGGLCWPFLVALGGLEGVLGGLEAVLGGLGGG